MSGDCENGECSVCGDMGVGILSNRLEEKIESLEQKLKIATEALGVYANEKNWDQDGIPDYYFTAQKALKRIEEVK